jgi:hypothetical protein
MEIMVLVMQYFSHYFCFLFLGVSIFDFLISFIYLFPLEFLAKLIQESFQVTFVRTL